MITIEQFRDAQRLLAPVIQRTSLVSAPGLDVLLKAENLQRTGSFKLRGAYFKISRLSKKEKERGVVASSAGNHAQGVAFAAKAEGIECVICMPEGAAISKIERTRSYGAQVVLVPGVYDDAYAHACKLRDERGYTLVHPFDDLDIITGQGTIGLEILEQAGNVDMVIVPVGGGGLLAGVGTAVKALNPDCQVIGVEAAGAASMKASFDAGKPIMLDSISTIADGIAIKKAGTITYDLCKKCCDEIVTVTEGEIASAILVLLEDYKVVAEAAGAVSVAAVMHGKIDIAGKKVVCLISGGNVDVNVLERVISQGLAKTGRVMEINVVLDDKPRQLSGLIDLIADAGANIISVTHDRYDTSLNLGQCSVNIKLETRNRDHMAIVKERIKRLSRD